MRLQVISDLHTEFHKYPEDFCRHLQIQPELDFLVIAGDLIVPARQDNWRGAVDYLASKARHILYVYGNHEYYGSDKTFPESIQWADNWHVLYNDSITIEGVHFFGGTMWFPNLDQMNCFYQREVNDFSQINYLAEWVYQENSLFTQQAREQIRPETIVISHHLPSFRSVPGEYKASQTNRFFVSNQESLISDRQPRLFIHGHTHTFCDYRLGATRVLCNPYGYPSENTPDKYRSIIVSI